MGPQDPFSRPDRIMPSTPESDGITLPTLGIPLVAAIIGLVLGGVVGASLVFDFFWSASIILLTSTVFAALFFGAAKVVINGRWKEAIRILFAQGDR